MLALVGPSEMTFGSTKCGNLRYIIMYNIIWAYQWAECFVYHWLRAFVIFDIKRFPTFVRSIGQHFRSSVNMPNCQYVN